MKVIVSWKLLRAIFSDAFTGRELFYRGVRRIFRQNSGLTSEWSFSDDRQVPFLIPIIPVIGSNKEDSKECLACIVDIAPVG